MDRYTPISKGEFVQKYYSGQNHFEFLYNDAEDMLTYELKLPYDIHIMTSDPEHNRVLSHFSVLSNNRPNWVDRSQVWHLLDSNPFSSASAYFSSVMHRHNYFEMMFVLRGTVEQIIETDRYIYEEGSICLLNCDMTHAEIFSSDFSTVYFCISRRYLSKFLLDYIPPDSPLGQFFIGNTKETSDYKKDYVNFTPRKKHSHGHIEQLLNQITDEHFSERPGYRQIINGLILRLLGYLQDPMLYDYDYIQLDPSTEAYIFSKATRMMEHSAIPLSRSELAEALHYNGDYINRVIKKFTGMSIVQYNRSLQMKKAEWLLSESDRSISDIIRLLGYENRTHFYRAFQEKNNMTPLEYRSQFRRDPTTPPKQAANT